MTTCRICNHSTILLFKTKVLQKFDVGYHNCTNCGFIQTDKPFWLSEAYESAITSPDVGLVSRNLSLADATERIIIQLFDQEAKFIDYAGGYGLLVRLMRDKGFNYYRQDPYCQNIFALNLDVKDLSANPKIELATAFEVFEHWENPVTELEKILKYTDSILFSTELQPNKVFHSSEDWWYFIPETGQHLSFYTLKSLEILAGRFGLKFYSNGTALHLFTSRELLDTPFPPVVQAPPQKKTMLQKLINKVLSRKVTAKPQKPQKKVKSLLDFDFENAKQRLVSNNHSI